MALWSPASALNLPAESPGMLGQARLSPPVGPVQIPEASYSCYFLEWETPTNLGSGAMGAAGCSGIGEHSNHHQAG